MINCRYASRLVLHGVIDVLLGDGIRFEEIDVTGGGGLSKLQVGLLGAHVFSGLLQLSVNFRALDFG